jgi:hypothetical protein
LAKSIRGNSSSMVERFIVVEDTSVRFCGFALIINTTAAIKVRDEILIAGQDKSLVRKV